MSILLLIGGMFLFVMLVVVHEWGHFIAARKAGVEVEEFGIGFPPRIYGRNFKNNETPWFLLWQSIIGVLTIPFGGGGSNQKLKKDNVPDSKKTVYTINAIPLGGFVKLKGEHDADTEPGTYGAANIKDKTKIMLAGVGMNLITALILFTIVAIAGMPKLIDNQFTIKSDTKILKNEVLVGLVEEDSPAAKAKPMVPGDNSIAPGLQVKDRILLIRSMTCGVDSNSSDLVADSNLFKDEACLHRVTSASELPMITKTVGEQVSDGKVPVIVTIERDGQIIDMDVTLRSQQEVETSQKTTEPKGYLGVAPAEYTLQRSTWSAPIVAVGLTVQLTKATLAGVGNALWNLVTGNAAQAGQQVTGPVGIFAIFKEGSLLGYQFILMLVAIISLTLAIMNALPIPALDGGRLFVTWLFRLSHRKLTKKMEERIHGTGFAILMILFVLITIVDVRRFF